MLCPVFAARVYVNETATGGNHGTSWHHAYRFLSSALAHAEEGDDIWVAEGVYRPTGDEVPGTNAADRAISFVIPEGVAVYGGFAGTEGFLNQRNPSVNLTVLSGDIDANDSQQPVVTNSAVVAETSNNSSHVLYFGSNITVTTVLDGVTVTAGRANYSDPVPYGGGMLIDGGSPLLVNVNFEGNYARNGGALALRSSSLEMCGCTLKGNRVYENGGGGHIDEHSSLTFIDGVVSSNYAGDYGFGSISGGGGFLAKGFLRLSGCELVANFAEESSGGAVNAQGTFLAEDCIFRGNRTSAPGGGYGSAVHQGSGVSSMSIVNCEFEGNDGYRGAVYINNDTFVSGCLFTSNTASYGAALYSNADNLYVMKSRFIGNVALDGGAVMDYYSNLTFSDCVFEGNRAEDDGGAVESGYGGTNIFSHCVFSGNSAGDGGALNGRFFYVDHCVFSNNTASAEYRGYGGAINGSSFISNSLFEANYARFEGGAVSLGGDLDVVNCSFINNRCDKNGGAIYARAELYMENCTVSGNTAADDGGGIFNLGSLDLVHCSIVGNAADLDLDGDGSGGGVYSYDLYYDRPVRLQSSVIAGNRVRNSRRSSDDFIIEDEDEFEDLGHNLFGIKPALTLLSSTQVGSASTPLDPLLEPLADNGGPMPTRVPMVGSPVLDAGYSSVVCDQRGYPRPGGIAPDIGAVEYLTPAEEATSTCLRATLGPGTSDDPDGDGKTSWEEWIIGSSPVGEDGDSILTLFFPERLEIAALNESRHYVLKGKHSLKSYDEWEFIQEFKGTNAVFELDIDELPYQFYGIDVSIR